MKNKKIDSNRKFTYISLFSSAGVGCYGFKMEDFNCVATNELIKRRLEIQKINNKCKYETGYICGDITKKTTKKLIFDEIKKWKNKENIDKIDVLMATPPCQGMSTANYKKNNEIIRNSLVVEAIHMIKKIMPRVFVFENVRTFLDTMCIDKNKQHLSISSCININLGNKYNIFSRQINFMDYGVPSSRPRVIVIGTLKTEKNFSPLNIFPLSKPKISLREAIGDLPSLKFGSYDKNDFYHSFRTYPKYMRKWIHNLKQNESAFSNPPNNLPYKIVNGRKQILKSGFMGNKFCRMNWDKPATCITTRNDQLASQSTIHPSDDRVLSIRELMRVMTIPDSFKWVNIEDKIHIANNESLIRQSIGEAVPTKIIKSIAHNIKEMLEFDDFVKLFKKRKEIDKLVKNKNNFYIQSFIFEQKTKNKKASGSFFTPQIVAYNSLKNYNCTQKNIKILEPSVGMGAFLPQIFRLVDSADEINFDLIDLSDKVLKKLRTCIKTFNLHPKFKLNFIKSDFLEYKNNSKKYDLIISNPPYFKLSILQSKKYKKLFDFNYSNIYLLFMKRFLEFSDEIICVIPKTFLMTPESNKIREEYQSCLRVLSVVDYGVNLFNNVFIEIISIHFTKKQILYTHILNLKLNIERNVKFDYIYHDKLWLIYRSEWFDKYIKKLKLNIFNFFRDRQITNKLLSKEKKKFWVIRSKNLLDNGSFVHIDGYDRYINSLSKYTISNFLNKNCVVFTNFTYNTRASFLPNNCIVNGSLCVFIPKMKINKSDLKIFITKSFRKYYSIVKNLSKFTLNVDRNSIYYLGVKNKYD
ncbi:MAG: DNA cytosine methyltransferase [Mycoplasma sp.]|nr:DNA cytosine methyltransferase [Mycoplasma sp.]